MVSRIFGFLTALALGVLPFSNAHGSCGGDEPARIVWAYPGADAVDVPTNTDIWLMPAPYGGPAEVWVGDIELHRASTGGYERFRWVADELELQPNTDYQLRLIQQTMEGPLEVSRSFRTGTDALESPSVETLPDVEAETTLLINTLEWKDVDQSCSAVGWAQDCFDVSPNSRIVFPFDRADIAFWAMDRSSETNEVGSIWPGQCGGPQMMVRGTPSGVEECVIVYGMGAHGRIVTSGEVCWTADVLPALNPDSSNDQDTPQENADSETLQPTTPQTSTPGSETDAAACNASASPVPSGSLGLLFLVLIAGLLSRRQRTLRMK